jgi:heme-degrading monooxygenase HmoA
MVIRIVTGRVKQGREGEFNALMREQRLPEMRRQGGFVYAKFGRQIRPDGERFIFISEWRDVSSLYDWIGPDLTKPVTIRGAEHLVDEYKVELYEAMDVPLQPETAEPQAGFAGEEPPPWDAPP